MMQYGRFIIDGIFLFLFLAILGSVSYYIYTLVLKIQNQTMSSPNTLEMIRSDQKTLDFIRYLIDVELSNILFNSDKSLGSSDMNFDTPAFISDKLLQNLYYYDNKYSNFTPIVSSAINGVCTTVSDNPTCSGAKLCKGDNKNQTICYDGVNVYPSTQSGFCKTSQPTTECYNSNRRNVTGIIM